MPVRRDPRTGGWFFRTIVKTPDGRKLRVFGTPGVPGPFQDCAPTKVGAQAAEQRAIQRALAGHGAKAPAKKEVPTFDEWFNGRFWREWVIARKNKPTEVRSKRTIYRVHLKPAFGDMRLDEIDDGAIAEFRAKLVEATTRFKRPFSDKRINNILAVLSKPLHYAQKCKLIEGMPEIGILKVERPEIEAWEFDQYTRILETARANDAEPEWYTAVCLAGEAGLRIGEIKALRWREDVDLVARTITVSQQTCNGATTTPKARTRRTIPMTTRLWEALKRLDVVRTGLVVRNLDGTAKTDGEANHAIDRLLRRTGLPSKGWHRLRHSFGTHAALFGVNPWRLQAWMGHKRIDETMLYVHVASAHMRELPGAIREAAEGIADPDQRIIAMLGARGSHVAARTSAEDEKEALPAS